MNDALGQVETVALLGGTSDIGLAAAHAFVRQGARHIVLAARDQPRVQAASKRLADRGAEVRTVALDAERFDEHDAVVETICRELGEVDVAILAIGVLGDQLADERNPEAVLLTMRVNLLASLSLGMRMLDHLRRQGHGTLVVLSSVAAERPRRSNFIYGASKAGLDAFFQGKQAEISGTGPKILLVRPGFVRTRMTAHLRNAPLSVSASKVALAIVDGVARGAEIVWVPRSLRWVMSVLRHLPPSVFRKLNL